MTKVFIAIIAILSVGIVSMNTAEACEIKHEDDYSTQQLAALTRAVERTEKSLELVLHHATLSKDDRKFLEATLEDLQETRTLWESIKCDEKPN